MLFLFIYIHIYIYIYMYIYINVSVVVLGAIRDSKNCKLTLGSDPPSDQVHFGPIYRSDSPWIRSSSRSGPLLPDLGPDPPTGSILLTKLSDHNGIRTVGSDPLDYHVYFRIQIHFPLCIYAQVHSSIYIYI